MGTKGERRGQEGQKYHTKEMKAQFLITSGYISELIAQNMQILLLNKMVKFVSVARKAEQQHSRFLFILAMKHPLNPQDFQSTQFHTQKHQLNLESWTLMNSSFLSTTHLVKSASDWIIYLHYLLSSKFSKYIPHAHTQNPKIIASCYLPWVSILPRRNMCHI